MLVDNLNETLQPDPTAMDQQLTTDLYSRAEQTLIFESGKSRDTMTSGNADSLTVERKFSLMRQQLVLLPLVFQEVSE